MEREYDLFERFPDDSLLWCRHVSGLRNASLALTKLAKTTTNECLAINLSTNEIVARLNVGVGRRVTGKPVVFQIAYD